MNHTISLNPYIFLGRSLISKKTIKINFKIFWFLSFVLISSLLVVYVFQINKITKEGYLIKSYIEKTNNLSQANKVLEINLANNSSLENIRKMAEDLNFEKINRVKYIQILENALVSR